MLVSIEQRLQDPPRFLLVPADEAALFGLPFMMGLLSKAVVTGFAVGFVIWLIWKQLKGESGLVGMVGALYWYLPSELKFFPGLPDSSVSVWEG